MKRDAIISLCIALPVANLPFWQWRSPAEMLLMVGLFWQVAFVAVVGTGIRNEDKKCQHIAVCWQREKSQM